MTERPLRLGLNRPQYVSNPDLLLVALAHRLHTVDVPKAEALIFRNLRPQAKVGQLTYRETSPMARFGNTDAALKSWIEALSWCGVDTDTNDALLEVAQALAGSIVSARAERAQSVNALPMTPMTALLQEPRGMLAVSNPPNFALILEQLHALSSANPGGVTKSWYRAALARLHHDPLAAMLDSATVRSLLSDLSPTLVSEVSEGLTPAEQFPAGSLAEVVQSWTDSQAERAGSGTPMVWFARNWERITSPTWVEALPARRWVDWASTVLRHGFAFGFLWESHLFRGLADLVLDTVTPITSQRVGNCVNSHRALLKWRDADLSSGARALSLKRDVLLGLSAMRFFETITFPDGTDPVTALEALRGDRKSVERLREDLSVRQTFPKDENVWEAIRYALLIRQESGALADHYGLLRSNNRWLYPDPGVEWVVVMGSLCAGPGGRTTAGVLLAELNQLGIDVSLPELLRLVEASGLAELAADADQAVIIESAF